MAHSPGLVFRFKSDSGMSLIEVMISIGILAVVVSGMASYMSSSSREVRALTESLAKLDIEKFLIASLADGVSCTAELANPGVWTPGALPATFNSTNATTLAKTSINLNSIHASAAANAPVLISNGAAPSAMANGLLVNRITVGNFQATGAPDVYLADLTVSFTGSIRQPSPIVLRKTIATVPTGPTTKKITGCLSASNPSSVGGLIKLSDYPAVFGGQRTVDEPIIFFGKVMPGMKYLQVTPAGFVLGCNSLTGCPAPTAFSCNIFQTGSCNGSTLTSSGIQVFTPNTLTGCGPGCPPKTAGLVLHPWK